MFIPNSVDTIEDFAFLSCKSIDFFVKMCYNVLYFDFWKGNLFYEDVDVKAFFDITLPEGFTEENALWYKYSFDTLGEGKKNKCTIDFGEVKEFKKAKATLVW